MATQVINLTDLTTALESRISKKLSKFEPDSPELKEAMLRIGFMLEAEVKLNIRRKGIVDTGRLLNSIKAEFFRRADVAGIRIGSVGVPYASINEFGGEFTEKQRRAMFAALKDRGRLGKNSRPSKNVIQGNRYKARPFIRPAVKKLRKTIIEELRFLLK